MVSSVEVEEEDDSVDDSLDVELLLLLLLVVLVEDGGSVMSIDVKKGETAWPVTPSGVYLTVVAQSSSPQPYW